MHTETEDQKFRRRFNFTCGFVVGAVAMWLTEGSAYGDWVRLLAVIFGAVAFGMSLFG